MNTVRSCCLLLIQVREGEVVTSARAIDEATIRKMYEFNKTFVEQEYGPMSKKRKQTSPEQWAGKDLRTMLHALYVVAFHCLLRSDEALRIEWHWITYEEYGEGKVRLRVKLPFRKTHQTGGMYFYATSHSNIGTKWLQGIAPFFLYPNPSKPHLCPVKAVSDWLLATVRFNPELKGFVFKRKMSNKVSENTDHQMVR